MKEIQKNGPVVASMNVYIDFLIYKAGPKHALKLLMLTQNLRVLAHFSGVYSKSQENQRYLGKHSVKIIGWGSEHGEPYWLIQNSWGALHGEAGLARIRRGSNECGIEGEVYAPMPNFIDLIDLEFNDKLKKQLESLQQNVSNTNSSTIQETGNQSSAAHR